MLAEQELETREKPCAFVIDTLLALPDDLDIAKAVEDGERITLLEHTGAVVHPGRGRKNIILVANAYEVFHKGLYFSSLAAY